MQGKRWQLTEKRLKYVLKQLELQMTISSLAIEYGIKDETLSKRLKEAGIDADAVRKSGIAKLRKTTLQRIMNIADDKDMATVALKYLSKYDDTQVKDTTTAVTVDINSAASQVLDDLS